jgi:glutamate-ammonia-ligase adenylyltransferase
LLKACPIAGDAILAQQFSDLVQPFVYRDPFPAESIRVIRTIKARIERERLGAREDRRTQLKVGAGGLIDVEFTIQLLQLTHGAHDPRLRVQGTIAAIAAAADRGLVSLERGRWLVDAYRFLNRVRNTLYLLKGRPGDSLPTDPDELELLARPGARGRCARTCSTAGVSADVSVRASSSQTRRVTRSGRSAGHGRVPEVCACATRTAHAHDLGTKHVPPCGPVRADRRTGMARPRG